MAVTIKVQDSSGNELGSFAAEEGKTIAQMAEWASVEIPVSCGAGACFVCAVKVVSGKEYLQQDLMSSPLVDLEDNQFLTCIGGINPEYINGDDSFEVVLEKIL